MTVLILQGKFIRINFDVNGYIVGANIETCILPFKTFLPKDETPHVLHRENISLNLGLCCLLYFSLVCKMVDLKLIKEKVSPCP